ncbi:hypothetical protein B5C34_05675 [Pacificimonas flava]|uniref:Stringent starvation protein B n=2 Tax=Pacificimonas TaxID=1960290 RepID=A0A219B3R3_9SPHN|nr:MULTISPECIES: ClpXP protease specificity-enhancing factor SspB [Pacificimonas]MBZ6377289.1 hypothetical protein [Pacificimonas aurantium]OWV33000.1 hypothetical protein B5C34_05675 [Pacificimonas flava]
MSDDETPESLIPYDEHVQSALRGVVYSVLTDVAATGGLPGNHHFYIAFKTNAPGVDIPPHLKERYPDEMTIVVQHRFWDLAVDREGFEIGLSFNQVPAKLIIPFSAVVGFIDPSVNFALQFPAPDLPDAKPGLRAVSEEEEDSAPEGEEKGGSNVVEIDFRKK